MVRVLFDDAAQTPVAGELMLIALNMQCNRGAALGTFNIFDLIISFTFTGPANSLIGAYASATRFNHHALGNDK